MLTYNKGYPSQITYPVGSAGIPPNSASKLHTPMPGKPHDAIPPSQYGSEHYTQELLELTNVRGDIIAGVWPAEFLSKHHPRSSYDPSKIPKPLFNNGLTVLDGAAAARMVEKDLPTDIAFWCYRYVQQEKVKLTAKENPHTSFLQATPNMLCDIAVKIEANMLKTWEVKWFYGRARPEEAAHRLDQDRNITAYTNGCPFHPSYPAGHAAAAAAVTVLFDSYDLTTGQYEEIYDAAYMFSMFRTFAGVHLASDNIEGLRLSGFPIAHKVTW